MACDSGTVPGGQERTSPFDPKLFEAPSSRHIDLLALRLRFFCFCPGPCAVCLGPVIFIAKLLFTLRPEP